MAIEEHKSVMYICTSHLSHYFRYWIDKWISPELKLMLISEGHLPYSLSYS